MNYKGVIIRITPYKEKSAMISLLTKEGLLSFLARDIYKVNSKSVLLTCPLMYGEFTFLDNTKSNLLTYKEMSIIVDTRKYMNDFSKLASLNFLNEITISLFNEEEMKDIYPYLIEAITLLDKEEPINVLLSYLAISLRETGYGLNVDSCILSGTTKNIIGVNYDDGGLISKEFFRENIDKLYSSNKIKILHYIFKLNIDNMKNIKFDSKDAKEILEDLLVYTYNQTGLRLKSSSLINKIV